MATPAVKPTTPRPARRRKVYNSGNFFSTAVSVNDECVTIRLPKKVAEYLDVTDGKKLYWSPINGVIQISGNVPNITIPSLSMANTGFIPHSTE